MKTYRRAAALILAAAFAGGSSMTAFADSPQFAYDDVTWAKLKDNTMEYDELEMLVEEYNTNYLNNQSDFQQDRDGKNNEELRQQKYEDAQDLQDQADDLRSTADGLKDTLESISDSAAYLPYLPSSTGAAGLNSSGLKTLGTTYATLSAAAAMLEQNATSTKQAADASYEDQTTKNYSHQNTQLAIKAQTKSLFASYNLAKESIPTIEKNIEVANRSLESTERQAAQGLSTATDVLKAKNKLESLQSSLTSTKASVENLRQSLCIATGWKYTDQPDIKDLPAADPSRVDAMNPDSDTAKALDENLTLKYDRALLANMTDGSADRKNMERTIANQEQTVKSSVQTLYNTCRTDRVALEAANAALATEQKKMATVENQKALGMVTDLQYLNEQAQYLSAQVSAKTADMNLQQAIENYNWAMRGYIASGS